MYVITGISGNVGGKLAALLLESGEEVTGFTREDFDSTPLGPNAKIVVTDFQSPSLFVKEFKGAEGVFIMNPPFFFSTDPMEENYTLLKSYHDAILEAKPEKVVYLTSVGAHHSGDIGHIGKSRDMEKLMKILPIPTAGIRPALFMNNFAAQIQQVKDTGKLTTLFNDVELTLPMTAAQDISQMAFELMHETWSGHRIIELQGPSAYSTTDAAAILSNLLNMPVEAEATSVEQYPAIFASWGMPPKSVDLMIGSVNSFNTGRASFELKDTELRFGTTTLAGYLETLTK